uniref:Uncharacterized protein n=1 Tax=Anser cygnoides TaxID=8845 RepID=A0A8B9EP00_ANSCY
MNINMLFSVILPWLHFSLLYEQKLGFLLPVKTPILSSILVLQENSSSLYQVLLWRQGVGGKLVKISLVFGKCYKSFYSGRSNSMTSSITLKGGNLQNGLFFFF